TTDRPRLASRPFAAPIRHWPTRSATRWPVCEAGHPPAGPTPRLMIRLLAVVGLTIAVFLPALRGGFVGWDDVSLLVSHTGYRGLGPSHLAWMASNVTLGHYVPVVWLSFAVDYLLWGLNPVGYHLTNVVLHGVNAGLVFVLARTLIQRAKGLTGTALDVGSAAAALAFALHPLRVEAVAWVIGRRDLLCALWTLYTLLAYLRAAHTSG